MIAKPIWYTDHARGQMKMRGLTRADVRFLVARGVRKLVPSTSREQVWDARAYLRRREASVIFVESAKRYLIVTVQWIE